MDASAIMGLVFSGGTALAGLILVFLGFLLSSFDALDNVQKNRSRNSFRTRGWVAFGGFVCALLSASAALWHEICASAFLFAAALVMLALSGALLLAMAIVAMLKVEGKL